MAGVALGDIDSHFLCGAGAGLMAHRSIFVASAALGVIDIDLHFVRQAWHLMTSTFTCRRATSGTGLALVARLVPVWRRGRRGCLCGRALGDTDVHFV